MKPPEVLTTRKVEFQVITIELTTALGAGAPTVWTVGPFGNAAPSHIVTERHRHKSKTLFNGYVTKCRQLISISQNHVLSTTRATTCPECLK